MGTMAIAAVAVVILMQISSVQLPFFGYGGSQVHLTLFTSSSCIPFMKTSDLMLWFIKTLDITLLILDVQQDVGLCPLFLLGQICPVSVHCCKASGLISALQSLNTSRMPVFSPDFMSFKMIVKLMHYII